LIHRACCIPYYSQIERRRFTIDEFLEFTEDRDHRYELTKEGKLIQMPPPSAKQGAAISYIWLKLRKWNKMLAIPGETYQQAGWRYPDGSIKSPDVCWFRNTNIPNQTDISDYSHSNGICPDFVVEVITKSSDYNRVRANIKTAQDNGCSRGWIVDLEAEIVYRIGANMHILQQVGFAGNTVTDMTVPGFSLNLDKLKENYE